MDPQIFATSDDAEAPARFQRWQSANPAGYFINLKTSAYGMLHKVGCPHVGKPGEWNDAWGDVTKNPKVCHADPEVLRRWTRDRSVELEGCGDCRR